MFILWNLSSSGVEKYSGHNLHLNDSPLYIIPHVGIRYLDFNISTLDVCSAKIAHVNLHWQATPTLLNRCFIPAKNYLSIFRNSLLKKYHTVSLVTIKPSPAGLSPPETKIHLWQSQAKIDSRHDDLLGDISLSLNCNTGHSCLSSRHVRHVFSAAVLASDD